MRGGEEDQMRWMREHPVTSFVMGTFIFAWGCWTYLLITTPPGGMQAGIKPSFLLFALAGGFGPTLVALVLSRITLGKGGARKLLGKFSFTKGRVVWLFIALLTVPLVSTLHGQADIEWKYPGTSGSGNHLAAVRKHGRGVRLESVHAAEASDKT